MHEYIKHDLAEDSEDEKRILKSESRVKTKRKKVHSNLTSKRYSNSAQKDEFTPRHYGNNVQPRRASMAVLTASYQNNFKPGSCYSCGK